MAAGGILGSVIGDKLIGWVTATWTIRAGLLIEAGTHLALATMRSAYLIGLVLFAFGVHGFGLTAPYWIGFAVAAGVAAATWRVFSRATVAQAYATPAAADPAPVQPAG